MAYGFDCVHCGFVEHAHEDGLVGEEWLKEFGITGIEPRKGYSVSLFGCDGYESDSPETEKILENRDREEREWAAEVAAGGCYIVITWDPVWGTRISPLA